MPVVSENELTQSQKEHYRKAQAAVQKKNFDLAILVLATLVEVSPGFMDGRKLLRDACIEKHGLGKKGFFGGLGSMGSVFGAGKVKGDPVKAMADVLKNTLVNDPTNRAGNLHLAAAADMAGFPEVAAFALDTIAIGNPNDIKALHALAEKYIELKDPRAKEVYQAILSKVPNDGDAISGYKNAEAITSMVKGRWEDAGDFRDIIKDKDEAQRLEMQSRVVKDPEAIQALVAELFSKHEAEPNNQVYVRQMADLYRQVNDFDSALYYYNMAFDMTSRSDSGLEKTIYDVRLKQLDSSAKQWEEYAASLATDDPAYAETVQTMEGVQQQRREHVVSGCRLRVQKYPNDLRAKFDLGEALYDAGDHSGAIPELQQALRQPEVRVRAMLLLAMCFKAKGQHKVAASRLEDAEKEILGMDDTKKEIIYNLGLIYEEMGDKGQSLMQFQKIYEVEYGYRDVAQRVEQASSEA